MSFKKAFKGGVCGKRRLLPLVPSGRALFHIASTTVGFFRGGTGPDRHFHGALRHIKRRSFHDRLGSTCRKR